MTQTPPSQDPFELLRRMWSAAPVPGIMPPLLDANEIDKRIADLRSVENWLNMNLSMLRMTIQGLEMQKASVSAFRTMQETQTAAQQQMADAATAATAAASSAATSAAEAWWSMLQSATKAGAPDEPNGTK
jgi:uncharacterized protein involved in exopolysaccharide biosynthesis